MASPTNTPTTPTIPYYIGNNSNLIDLTTPKNNSSTDGYSTPQEKINESVGDLGTRALFTHPDDVIATPKTLNNSSSDITKTVNSQTTKKHDAKTEDTSGKDINVKTDEASTKEENTKTKDTSTKEDEIKPKTEETSAKKDDTKATKQTWWQWMTGAKPSQTPTAPVKSAPKAASLKSVSSEPIEVTEQEMISKDDTTAPATPAPILADAAWKKFVTIIPVVGLLSNVINQKSLRNHLDQNVGLEKKAWEIKRQYHGLSIARSMLETAIIAKIVAMGILGINIGLAIASIPLILLATHIYKCVQAHKESKKFTDTKPVTKPTEPEKEIKGQVKETDSDTVVVD